MPSAGRRLAFAVLCAALVTFAAAAQADQAAPTPPPDPIGAYSGGLYLETPGGQIVLFPGARLQVDGAFFPRQNPKSGVFLRRARVELRGWLASFFYFDVSGDFAPLPPGDADVPPSALAASDDYLAFAPYGDRLILQAGQFDAPFTLENRTSDAYTDFIERAMTARTLGAPRNKEVGVMAHGLLADGLVYYSGGLFNGEGPGFRNLDNQSDTIGRIVITPFLTSGRPWRQLAIGGSAWYGNHVLGPEAPVQATPGGMVFLEPHWQSGQTTPLAFELHEQGTSTAFGGELNLPIGDRFGARGEIVWKRQHLSELNTTASPSAPVGDAVLDGISAYGEIWLWLLGDGRLLPAPGLELPLRAGATALSVDEGLQLAIRGEVLKEDVTSDNPALGDPSVSTTRVVSGTIGLNYWRGRFVRLSANYVLNDWSGTSETIMTLAADGKLEHEILFRLAMSL
ncbi:MAG TPA: porin [Polyangia bacterium]|jgi:phosphate-selective porin